MDLRWSLRRQLNRSTTRATHIDRMFRRHEEVEDFIVGAQRLARLGIVDVVIARGDRLTAAGVRRHGSSAVCKRTKGAVVV